MSGSIKINLLDNTETVLKESEKKSCFFVGKEGEATNAEFEHAYEISNVEWPKDVNVSYEVGSRRFSNLSYSKGKSITKARGSYEIKKHPDGTVYLCMKIEYPTYDSYDRMYASHFQRVIYRENNEIVVIQAKHGRVVPKINIFIGLKESVPFLDRLLDVLGTSDSAQLTRLTMLTRCVTQKFWLSDDVAAKMENYILYSCLDAASSYATYGVFRAKGRMQSYDKLKSIADYIFGACLPAWYQTAPKRRHEILGEVIHYISKLKRDKFIEWSAEEKAFAHELRRTFDVEVFRELYAISLVLLRFVAENDFRDVQSLKKATMAQGVFSSTLMSDTVDGFSAKHLDGEARKALFTITGTDTSKAIELIEKALYQYHAGSNILFRDARTLTMQSGNYVNEKEAKAVESAVEKTVLAAAANTAVAYLKKLKGSGQLNDGYEEKISYEMCQKLFDLFGKLEEIEEDEEDAQDVYQTLMSIGKYYMRNEMKTLRQGHKTNYELMHEFVPENNFVLMYTIGFCVIRFLHQAAMKVGTYNAHALHYIFDEGDFINERNLKELLLEAKRRYSTLCSAETLDIMANLE